MAIHPDVVDPTVVAEQRDFYEQSMEAAHSNYVQWLAEFNARNIDARSLKLSEIAASYSEGPQSIDEAVREADVIVSGSAKSIQYQASPGLSLGADTLVSFSIDSTVKGLAPDASTIDVVLAGGPAPGATSRDPKDAILAYAPVSPPLFEGDKAILLLVKSSRYEGRYEPLAWVGVNRMVNGVIQANLFEGEDVNRLDGVTVRSQIHGMGAADFLDTLTTAAQESQ